MLMNLKELLNYAEKNKTAIGSFNYTNLESLKAIIKAAEEINYPVILSHAPVHDIFNEMELISPIAIDLAKKSKVPICIHLDHGMEVEYIKKAIDLGFTSVMFDGSLLPFDENVKLTQEVVKYAHKRKVSVEAELGRMPSYGLEGGGSDLNVEFNAKDYYTNPKEAKRFVELTKIDCLAISFGTVHGEYRGEVNLDFNVIKEIRDILNGFPLVMHGGSGVSEDDYLKAINAGIRKINYYTYMQIAGYNAVKELLLKDNTNQYHDIPVVAEKAMYENILKAMKIFAKK